MGATFLCEGGCGREIEERPRRKTRFCRSCCGRIFGSNPERAKKSSAAMKRLMADPSFKAAHVERTSAALREKAANDPAEAERRRESGRALFRTGLGHAAQPPGSEARMRVGRMTTERHLSWCPEHLRGLYRDLTKSKGYLAADARQVIEAEMERERANRGRRLSFDEQLRRVQNGARLVSKFEPRAADHGFTLGGVASGLI
ncbi:hypothetical protein [Sphingobium chungbukense]|uniref:Uncharacterized protein n=1 Tax=Sphingobium chungbukense TaxID=56193 RepID=A0A0M3AZ97_9SPHN|nr:hypothetical protein [Sphingobium chungbukense]KKW93884.1 hypothetical protein YP76_04325 [Sphingobium chungbukense]